MTWENRDALARILKPHLRNDDVIRPRSTTDVELIDLINFTESGAIAIARLSFSAGDPELRLVPLSIERDSGVVDARQRIIACLPESQGEQRMLCSVAANGAMSNTLTNLIASGSEIAGRNGILRGVGLPALASVNTSRELCLLPVAPDDGQRNASALLSNTFALKLFRKLEVGRNPDIATVRQLYDTAHFRHVAPIFGWLEYITSDGESMDAGVLHAYVENRSDLWRITLDELSLYLERAATEHERDSSELFRTYLQLIRLLGERTAEMHKALAGPPESEFAPEPFTSFSMRGAYHSLTSMAAGIRQTLLSRCSGSGCEVLEEAPEVLDRLGTVDAFFGRLLGELGGAGLRIRIHGDFHLGQVLHTGQDLVFIDFEGDSSRPMFERLLKTSPLVDVAGMLFSARYAAISATFGTTAGSLRWHSRRQNLSALTDHWYSSVAETFTNEYRRCAGNSGLVPSDVATFDSLLGVYGLGKSIYQLGYELSHRPDWVPVALRAFLSVTDELKSA
jgi:maltose alpha-D-glucosyltransferase/alpha-amylase